jgi:ribonuclease J
MPAWDSPWVSHRPRCCCAKTATSQLSAKGIKRDGKVPAGYVYVDGTVGDIGHGVLRDRQKLAEEGVVMVVVTVDNHQGSLSCAPVIETRGWVHAPEAEELLGEASDVVGAAVTQALRDGARDSEVAEPPRPQGPGEVRRRPHAASAHDCPGARLIPDDRVPVATGLMV